MTRNQELREEAKKRGYTHDNFKCLKDLKNSSNPNLDKWYYEGCTDTLYSNSWGNGGQVVYKEGVWAEIVKPMKTFTPISMKCTQEQFDAVKPKLKGLKVENITSFNDCKYLVNNLGEQKNLISNVMPNSKERYNRETHEEWNEEIFLKACGIETETLQEKEQRLLKELEEVRKAIEESKIKVGDWAVVKSLGVVYKRLSDVSAHKNEVKITNPQLIKLLEQEIK